MDIDDPHPDHAAALGTMPVRHRFTFGFDANPFWSSPLRALTAELALRADLDLDAAADVTMALEEAVAILMRFVRDDQLITGHVEITADSLSAYLSIPATRTVSPTSIPVDAFGWRVLCVLTDHAELQQSNGRLGVLLTKACAAGTSDRGTPDDG